ncbi:MAG: MOSC domain-containing protein [Burkholderiales bacterium]|nr:MOSC domain-containing protein [Burkholderiales bacterium]
MRVLSVNRGRAQPLAIDGHRVLTAIAKQPVAGPVAVRAAGLEGDEQADLSVHGGLAKAVYAYPQAHYAFWQTVRAQAGVAAPGAALAGGAMGENLTVEGMVEAELWVGDRWHLPGCVLVVTEPRQPCFKFNAAMGFKQAARLMMQSGYCGSYLAVWVPGSVQAGDAIVVEPGPREVGIAELFRSRARG